MRWKNNRCEWTIIKSISKEIWQSKQWKWDDGSKSNWKFNMTIKINNQLETKNGEMQTNNEFSDDL